MRSLAIPGVPVVHVREVWQDPDLPVTGPAAPPASNITQQVAHYTADDDLIDGDPGENIFQMPAYLRSMQAAYERERDYSLGYCWAIDWLGGLWEIRGFDIANAANKGDSRKTGTTRNANSWTYSVLCLVDGNDGMTPAMLSTFRALGWEMSRRAGRLMAVITHQQLDFTNCAGSGINNQVWSGQATPALPVIPPDPAPAKETIMLGRYTGFKTPSRPFDTRNLAQMPKGQTFHMLLPDAADPAVTGVTINVKVLGAARPGNLVVWCGETNDPPGTSNIDFAPGGVFNNEITVPLAGDNTLKVALRGAPGDTVYPLAHVVIDHVGNWTV